MDSVSKLCSNSMLEDLLSLNSKFLDVILCSFGWEKNIYIYVYTYVYAFNKIIICKNEARDSRMPAQKLADTHTEQLCREYII